MAGLLFVGAVALGCSVAGCVGSVVPVGAVALGCSVAGCVGSVVPFARLGGAGVSLAVAILAACGKRIVGFCGSGASTCVVARLGYGLLYGFH